MWILIWLLIGVVVLGLFCHAHLKASGNPWGSEMDLRTKVVVATVTIIAWPVALFFYAASHINHEDY